MAVLAIDPSSRVGWARWSPGADRPRFDVLTLGQGSNDLGTKLVEYRSWLIDQVVVNDISLVCIESFFINPGKTDQGVLLQQAGIYCATLEICTARQMRIERIDVGKWRSEVLKATAAPKHITGSGHRQKWIKERAISYCRARGWPIDKVPEEIRDNAADAACIMEYARRRLDRTYAAEQTPLFGGVL